MAVPPAPLLWFGFGLLVAALLAGWAICSVIRDLIEYEGDY